MVSDTPSVFNIRANKRPPLFALTLADTLFTLTQREPQYDELFQLPPTLARARVNFTTYTYALLHNKILTHYSVYIAMLKTKQAMQKSARLATYELSYTRAGEKTRANLQKVDSYNKSTYNPLTTRSGANKRPPLTAST